MCEPGSQCFLGAVKVLPSVAMVCGGGLRVRELRGLRMTGRQKGGRFRSAPLGMLLPLFFTLAALPYVGFADVDFTVASPLSRTVFILSFVLESVAWAVAGFTLVCDQRCGKYPCQRLSLWVALMCAVYAVEMSLAAVVQHQRGDDIQPTSLDFTEAALVLASVQFALVSVLMALLISLRTCTNTAHEALERACCEDRTCHQSFAASKGEAHSRNTSTSAMDCFATKIKGSAAGSSTSRRQRRRTFDWIDRLLFVTPQYQWLLEDPTTYGFECENADNSLTVVIDGSSGRGSNAITEAHTISMPKARGPMEHRLEWAGEEYPPQAVGSMASNQIDYSGQDLETWPTELEAQPGTSATFLSLYDNRLDRIPPSISLMTNLSELYLCKNNLRFLPSELFMLEKLTVLALNDNGLESVPSDIGNLQELTVLRLHNNCLTSLPREMHALTKLTSVTLSGNPLNEIREITEDRVMSANSFISSVFGNMHRLSFSSGSNESSMPRSSSSRAELDRAVEVERAVLASVVTSTLHDSTSVTFEPFSDEELVQMRQEEMQAAASSPPSHKGSNDAARLGNNSSLLSSQDSLIASALASHRVQQGNASSAVMHYDQDGGCDSDSDASTATPISSDDEGECDDSDMSIRKSIGNMRRTLSSALLRGTRRDGAGANPASSSCSASDSDEDNNSERRMFLPRKYSNARTCSTSNSILSLDSNSYGLGNKHDLSKWSVRVMVNESHIHEGRRFSFVGGRGQFLVEVYAPDFETTRWNLNKEYPQFAKLRAQMEMMWPGGKHAMPPFPGKPCSSDTDDKLQETSEKLDCFLHAALYCSLEEPSLSPALEEFLLSK